MNNNKGFTLVELLSVIVILGAVLVVAIPNIVKVIDKSKTDTYNQMIRTITKATKEYITSNALKIDNFSTTGDSTVISLQQLVDAGFLKNKIENPKTKTLLNLSSTITVTITSSGGYSYNTSNIN
jgi:prepilin-type N-terminal cleavage/methylation domain-containing protein